MVMEHQLLKPYVRLHSVIYVIVWHLLGKVVVVGVCLISFGTLPLDFRLTCGHQLTITA